MSACTSFDFSALDIILERQMSGAVAARNRYRGDRSRAGLGRFHNGPEGSAALIAMTSFPSPPMWVPGGGTPVGQPQWFKGMGQITSESRRTGNRWRKPSAHGLQLTGVEGREPRVRSSLRIVSQEGARIKRVTGGFCESSLSRTPHTADDEHMELQILSRLNGRTRGLNACR
jgi:hypothetical protein